MSNQSVTTHKFAAVLNKKIEPGKAMNALAHMSIALMFNGGQEFRDHMGFVDYADADANSHIATKNSYVILRADNSNKIRAAREAALASGVLHSDFTSSMQEGTFLEQLARTREMPEAELEYYGLCLFGEIDAVNSITSKFSLWR